jgi:SAM-dependent methyltransferase
MFSKKETAVQPIKLDLGCGTQKRAGFFGVDRRRFAGVDGVTDLTRKSWIFEDREIGGIKLLAAEGGYTLPDNSVAEAYCSHFLEHLEHNQRAPERVRFMNELWRVLIPGGAATIITPHWASNRAYGDFTHADKPVTEMFYSYLDKAWRHSNAPDNDIEYNPDGYYCDFESKLGHSIHPEFASKTPEEYNFAVSWYKDAAMELHASLTARK